MSIERNRWLALLEGRPVEAVREGHWAEGFVPSSEIEAFMGRQVDPLEEVEIRRNLNALLGKESH